MEHDPFRVPELILAAISYLKLLHQYGQHEFIPVLELAKAGYQAKDKVNVFLNFGFHAPGA